jgi:hypothetical protein
MTISRHPLLGHRAVLENVFKRRKKNSEVKNIKSKA